MNKNTKTVLTIAALASAAAVAYVVYKRHRAAAISPTQQPAAFSPPPSAPVVYTPPSSPNPADVWAPTDPLEVSIDGLAGLVAAQHAASSHAFENPGDRTLMTRGYAPPALGDVFQVGYDGYDNQHGNLW